MSEQMFMKIINANQLVKIFVVVGMLILCRQTFGQSKCLTNEEAQTAIKLINSPRSISEDKTLRLELLNMSESRRKLEQKIIDNLTENQKLIQSANEIGEKNLLRLCEIIKQYGWVSKELVGEDGAAAALSLIRSSRDFDIQRQIFPVVVAAAKKGYVGNNEVAWLIDSIRSGAGLPQIFGTQTKIKNETFYLFPILNEAKVDEYRKLYNLPPLAEFIKYLQSKYQMVVLKSPPMQISQQPKEKQGSSPDTNAITANPLADLENDEIVKVESNLVNLNVRVSSNDLTATNSLTLQKSDFAVFEDGKKQEITFFSTIETPFDLILMLDLSGSTADKQNLIRKSTQRFIEAARPSDRIAIVIFTDEAKIISDLTSNREELLKSIKKINDRGGSAVWGSLQFVYDKIVKTQSNNRRTAVLMMTDGVDSSLLRSSWLPPSYPTFTDLLETMRSNNTVIFPIYLDTEAQSFSYEKQAYRTAQKTLGMLAEESGGQMYYAKKVNDLNGIYEKIINELGKVYSLGYEPSNDILIGTFHSLTVKLPNHPNLNVRAKKGYYAK
jgi:VWFA-related protein